MGISSVKNGGIDVETEGFASGSQDAGKIHIHRDPEWDRHRDGADFLPVPLTDRPVDLGRSAEGQSGAHEMQSGKVPSDFDAELLRRMKAIQAAGLERQLQLSNRADFSPAVLTDDLRVPIKASGGAGGYVSS
ncbi:MAG: hypothetical protein AAFQ82_27875, partial [Myxococcota bacterium]